MKFFSQLQSIAKKYNDNGKQEKENNQELLETNITFFYWIAGTPGTGIKPPNFMHYKVFVQSTSQGSRCLKSKTLLLYKV